ncbi:MAG: hypothetical protein ACKOEO_10945 [Planctomycetaceae bacterium]
MLKIDRKTQFCAAGYAITGRSGSPNREEYLLNHFENLFLRFGKNQTICGVLQQAASCPRTLDRGQQKQPLVRYRKSGWSKHFLRKWSRFSNEKTMQE